MFVTMLALRPVMRDAIFVGSVQSGYVESGKHEKEGGGGYVPSINVCGSDSGTVLLFLDAEPLTRSRSYTIQ